MKNASIFDCSKYNSQSGQGVAGLGWHVGGLSLIERCALNLTQDGVIDGVDFDDNDTLCLDGQRLFPLADGTYRTEIDTFEKITLPQGLGSEQITVHKPSGDVLIYRPVVRHTQGIYTWGVSQVQNALGYGYTVDYEHNSPHPKRIDFINPSQAKVGGVSVEFEYKASGLQRRFIHGERFDNARTLSRIRIPNRVYYELETQQNQALPSPQVTAIKQCFIQPNKPEACVGKTVFNYQTPDKNYHSTVFDTGQKQAHLGLFPMDINGDGLSDMVRAYSVLGRLHLDSDVADGQGGYATNTFEAGAVVSGAKFLPMDINGDGLSDLVATSRASARLTLTAYTSNGDGSYTTRTYNTGHEYSNIGIFSGDVNGDGLSDVIQTQNKSGRLHLVSHLFNEAGEHSAKQFDTGQWSENMGLFVTDVNGDGLSDVVQVKGHTAKLSLTTYLSNGDGTYTAHQQATEQGNDNFGFLMVDVNGDGLNDIVQPQATGTQLKLINYLSKGNGTYDIASHDTGQTAGNIGIYTGDVNGDGLGDVIQVSKQGGKLNFIHHISQGDGTYASATYVSTIERSDTDDTHVGLYVVDSNGDGLSDIVQARRDNTHNINTERGALAWVTHIQQGHAPLLNIITPRLGKPIHIDYGHLGNGALYTRTPRTYPMLEGMGSGSQVVATYTRNAGNVIRYHYQGLAYDVKRRANLGFAQITRTTQANQQKTREQFNQNYPYIGTVAVRERFVENTLIAKEHIQYAHQSHATPYRVYPTQNTTWAYNPERAGEVLSKTETLHSQFDAFAYPNTTTSTHYDGAGQTLKTITTHNQYQHDEAHWRLGLLRHSKVQWLLPTGEQSYKELAFEYDANTGLLTKEVLEPDRSEYTQVTQYRHDAQGNVIETQIKGEHKTFNYDGTLKQSAPFARISTTAYEAGDGYVAGLFPTTFTNAKSHVAHKTYEPIYGKVRTQTDANGVTTAFEYDELGRLIKTIPAVGQAVQTRYAWCSDNPICPDKQGYTATTTTEGIAGQSVVYYNRFSQAVRTATPDREAKPIYVNTDYDALDRPIKTTEPSYQVDEERKYTQTTYDYLNRITALRRVDGLVDKTHYNGYRTTHEDVLGRIRTEDKNSFGQITRITDPLQGSIEYTYTAQGQLRQTKTCAPDVGCSMVNLSYDARGYKTQLDDPDMGLWHYRYNSVGELVWQKDAKGQVATMTYDALGRMTSRTYAEGTSFWYYDSAEHGKGKLHLSLGVGNHAKAYTYDAYGRVSKTTTSIDAQSFVMQTEYDKHYNRVNALTYPTGFKLQYAYTNTGQVSTVHKFGDADHTYWSAGALCSNKAGVLCTAYLGTRTGSDAFAGIRVSQSLHDLNPWVIGQDARIAGGEQIQGFSYSYDAVGNLSQRAKLGGWYGAVEQHTERFTYDALDRVTSAHTDGQLTGQYTYDGFGNLTYKTGAGAYTYGEASKWCDNAWAGPHAVTQTQINGRLYSYCYDQNGNRTHNRSYDRTVRWNSFNKAKRIEESWFNWSEFSYDANLTRYRQYNSDLTTTFYVGMDETGAVMYERERNGLSVTNKNHIYVNGQRIAVKMEYEHAPIWDRKEKVHYLLTDNLGSVTAVVDQDGKVLTRKSYDVWGKERNAQTWQGTGEKDPNHHRGYTGHEYLHTVGFVNMNGRIYDPTLGRFMSADPIIQNPYGTQSYNRYSYVHNNPLKNVDPTGYVVTSNCTYDDDDYDGPSQCTYKDSKTGDSWTNDYSYEKNDDGTYTTTVKTTYRYGDPDKKSISFSFSYNSAMVNKFNSSVNKIKKYGTIAFFSVAAIKQSKHTYHNPAINIANTALSDGKLNLFEANKIWRNNIDSKFEVTVDATKLTVLQTTKFRENGMAGGRIPYTNTKDWLVHGSVTLYKDESGKISIMSGEYDFRPHAGNSVKVKVRNFEAYGGFYLGSFGGIKVGNDYWVNYVGSPKVIKR